MNAEQTFTSAYRVYYVSTDNILMWMCEVLYYWLFLRFIRGRCKHLVQPYKLRIFHRLVVAFESIYVQICSFMSTLLTRIVPFVFSFLTLIAFSPLPYSFLDPFICPSCSDYSLPSSLSLPPKTCCYRRTTTKNIDRDTSQIISTFSLMSSFSTNASKLRPKSKWLLYFTSDWALRRYKLNTRKGGECFYFRTHQRARPIFELPLMNDRQ
jgi:hypothetical protein